MHNLILYDRLHETYYDIPNYFCLQTMETKKKNNNKKSKPFLSKEIRITLEAESSIEPSSEITKILSSMSCVFYRFLHLFSQLLSSFLWYLWLYWQPSLIPPVSAMSLGAPWFLQLLSSYCLCIHAVFSPGCMCGLFGLIYFELMISCIVIFPSIMIFQFSLVTRHHFFSFSI